MKISKLFKKIPPKLTFFFVVAIVLLMPFTISTLLTEAEEGILNSNEEFQKLEEELNFLNQKEQEVLESLKGIVAEEQAEIVLQEEENSLVDPDGEIDELGGSANDPEGESEPIADIEGNIGVINPEDEMSEPEIAEEPKEEIIDPVIAPSQVKLKLKIKGGDDIKPGKLLIRFVGVGRDPVEIRPDEEGRISLMLDSGRYLVEVESNYYEEGEEEDLPSFFLQANKEVDLGTSEIVKK
jgi:hypothetical protein